MSSQTENSSFNLVPQALQIVGMVCLLILCYLGLNYLWRGSVPVALAIALVGGAVIYALVHLLVRQKRLDENRGVRPLEYLLLGAFILMAVASFFPLSHLVNVDFLAKEEIRQEALDKLDELEEMTEVYKRQMEKHLSDVGSESEAIIKDFDEDGPEQVFRTELARFGIDPGSGTRAELIIAAEQRRKTVLDNYRSGALRNSTTSLEKEDVDNVAFTNNYGLVIDQWYRQGLYDALQRLETRYAEYVAFLTDMFVNDNPQETAWNEAQFDYKPSDRVNNLIDNRGAVIERYQPVLLWSVLLVIVLCLMILSPYLWEKRQGDYIAPTKYRSDKEKKQRGYAID